jgi:hypothetical protein
VSAVATAPVRTDVAPAVTEPAITTPGARLFDPPGGELTLEDLILGRWDELVVDGETGCPVCGDRLRAGADCAGCGSSLG